VLALKCRLTYCIPNSHINSLLPGAFGPSTWVVAEDWNWSLVNKQTLGALSARLSVTGMCRSQHVHGENKKRKRLLDKSIVFTNITLFSWGTALTAG